MFGEAPLYASHMTPSVSIISVLENAGRAFIKVFLPAILVVLVGVSQQNSLHGAVGYGIAGLFASIAAALTAIQTYVPQLTVTYLIGPQYGQYADAFIHGFLGAFVTAVIGILREPSYSAWHSLIIAAFVGALTAGLQGIESVVAPDPTPPVKPVRTRAS